MLNNQRNGQLSYAGIPYEDINWYDIAGQPFGIAVNFNAIVFEDANNIIDTKGAFAVGRDFVSSRGLSLAFGNDGNLVGTGYSPNSVRFLVGRNVSMQGPLVVIGHVVAGGTFRAANGSTYMIRKDGTADQLQILKELYQAQGGSPYWTPSDRGTHYAISSYDVPRYIPAQRIGADVNGFFREARESMQYFHECITRLMPNGTVTERFHENILQGNDPVQNVFVIDARPNGILNKEIRFEIPDGSIAIVILRTGNNAHIQYGLWGSQRLANRTLYVFEDATNIYMEVPAAIWGSILAPNAMFHAHRTGGHVSGNAAFRSFAVNTASGFEFHLYPFVGGVICENVPFAPGQEPEPEVPQPEPVLPTPSVQPISECPPCPESEPCPQPEPCPEAEPCPPCPQPEPCPEAEPCPPCPQPEPCPEAEPCPPCPQPEPCPEPEPCPPCPQPEPCLPCPETRIEYRPYPVRVPVPCPRSKTRVIYRRIMVREKVNDCKIEVGKIFGCIWGCGCNFHHEYKVNLYKVRNEGKILLHSQKLGTCGCFEFNVPYDDCYVLEVCPVSLSKKNSCCRPMFTLKNVGVSSLMILN